MDTGEFLNYVIAPGNFLAITTNRTPDKAGGFSVRLFPRNDVANAAGYARWATRKGWDVYHSNASFVTAQPDGTDALGFPKYRGTKDTANVHQLRSFWLDLDCKRDGDKKDPSQVFPDQAAALAWVTGFYQASGLPKPNLVVRSGYGLHVYWIMENPMSVASWTPYAARFKSAVVAHGFTGDVAVIADAARILRPAGTANHKVAGTPALVAVIDALSAGEIVNSMMLTALMKFSPAAVTTVIAPSNALQGTASVTLLAHARASGVNMAAAAAAGVQPTGRPRHMMNIVPKCEQLRISLMEAGKNDKRTIWYLGNLSLAHFCVDGADYVHRMSSGHPGYTAVETDKAVADIAKEHDRKQQGPPSCGLFNAERRGVCPSCPSWGKINSPWHHGVDDGDLPSGYRRNNGRIEFMVKLKDGGTMWDELVQGDVHSGALDSTPDGVVLSFTYVRSRVHYAVQLYDYQMSADNAAMRSLLAKQHVTVERGMEGKFGEFIVAWIQELRDQYLLRADVAAPYGWHMSKGGHGGFAVGGELYLPNGAVERVAGGDRQIHTMYQPTGDLALWKQAADLVVKDRPPLAAIVAVAFGAPLMKLTGQSGVVISPWSRDSGVGKSAAITVGQTAWAQKRIMTATNDTANSIARKASEGRVMPVYWDETLVGQANTANFVSLIFQMAQGKERSRLTSDSTMRETGEWQTMVCTAGNRPLMDTVISETEATSAGALRLFEYSIPSDNPPNDTGATKIIAKTDTNYGQAGRVYAKWLAMNYPTAEAVILHAMKAFTDELQARRDERLYIAGIGCIYAGASIAKSLGLVEFTLPELREFLCKTFLELRAAREQTVLTSAAGYNLPQILGQFITDHGSQKIVTSYFTATGYGKAPLVIITPSNNGPGVVIHIGEQNQAMRIDKGAFVRWARKRNMSGLDIIGCMVKVWQAAHGAQNILGGGTPFAAGKVTTVEIPLTHPDLQAYLPAPPAPLPTTLRAPPTP
jgi:hypothetical protein